jgi:archaellum biogenesis ATPase FlaH
VLRGSGCGMNDKVEGIRLDFNEKGRIRSFLDIPNIITMEVPPVEYLVLALGIARNSITLWTGPDGDAKTYLAQSMSIQVARGADFLGMPCRQSPVLYIDLENAAYVVQDRLRQMTGDESVPGLRVWGIWNEQQPPQFGSELLLTIAKETKPLIIIDPFRYFHMAEENDSTAMSAVMQYLRALAAYGCAVVILHHQLRRRAQPAEVHQPFAALVILPCSIVSIGTADSSHSRWTRIATAQAERSRFGPISRKANSR